MNIAMMHFRVGETDGVSLEMDKWKLMLEKAGHQVYYIAGSEGTSKAFVVPEMYYRDDYDAQLNHACFVDIGSYTPESLKDALLKQSKKIEDQLVRLFHDLDIDLIIPNNLLCLGRSPHIAMALTEAVLKADVDVIGHHHDFYWEREYFAHPTTPFVEELLETYFPPVDLEDMRHVVINTPAQKDLWLKKGLKSSVVPNVFDFDMEQWVDDDFNSTFKKDLGIKENQVIFLQATRVTNRKAIELAIDLVSVLNEPAFRGRLIGRTLYNGKVFDESTELVLVMVGLHEGLEGYEDMLIEYGQDKGVTMIVEPESVDHKRHMDGDRKTYALWDAYVHCDLITYPSIYEGWGNQFLEGLFAKKPQVVFEYSIFESDISSYGFDFISLGNKYTVKANGFAEVERSVLERAAYDVIDYLTDADRYRSCVEKNFDIGKKHLSLPALEEMINRLFKV